MALANGSLDTSFGIGGKVTTSIGSAEDYAKSIAIQSDGKIIVAGYSWNESRYDFALSRYNIDGSLDTTFGIGGKVTTSIGSEHSYALSVAIQGDGKIVVVGYTLNDSDADLALARYNLDGSLDTSFGLGGIVTTAIEFARIYANFVAIQGNGKIVLAGYVLNESDAHFALARYNIDGSLDTSFGIGGIVTTAVGSYYDIAYSVKIQSDGKIVVAGYSWNGSDNDVALVRYNIDGSLDTSFGIGGKIATAIGSSEDAALSMAIQSDGKIVAAGYSYIGRNRTFALARYNSDGSLDTSFGIGGKVTTAIGSASDQALSMAIQSDGKIVAAGSSENESDDDFALVRYNVDGSLDTSFGIGGIVTTAIGSSFDYAYSVAIQSNGKIVAVGHSFNGSDEDFVLARYNATPTAEELAAAAREAAAKREAAKQSARIEIIERFKNMQKATVELFDRAEILGITPGNIDQLHVEIFALPQRSRSEITQVLKVARKYEVLGIIASERVRTIYSNSLIEIGLISKESKYKETLTRVVKGLSFTERSSYAGIKDAIEAELAAIQARKDRLAKILAQIASR